MAARHLVLVLEHAGTLYGGVCIAEVDRVALGLRALGMVHVKREYSKLFEDWDEQQAGCAYNV